MKSFYFQWIRATKLVVKHQLKVEFFRLGWWLRIWFDVKRLYAPFCKKFFLTFWVNLTKGNLSWQRYVRRFFTFQKYQHYQHCYIGMRMNKNGWIAIKFTNFKFAPKTAFVCTLWKRAFCKYITQFIVKFN